MQVIVVGAGIAGLTTGIALARAGHDVEVLERTPTVRGEGGGIHLWHNAMRAYAALGCAEAIRRVGARMATQEFRSSSGRLLASWDIGGTDEELGAVTVGVGRRDLHDVLLAHLPPARLVTAAEVVGVEESPQGVTAKLADGRVLHADLLVGADGIRSTVRRVLHGDTPTRYAGYVVWQGVVDGIDPARARPGLFRLHYGPGSRFAWYHLGGDRLYWFALFDAPERAEDDPLTAEPDPRPALLERFGDWPDPVGDVIAATPVAEIGRFAQRDRPPDRRWSTARTTLVGDAAHAMTFNVGQGACMGVEDAVVLADALTAVPDLPAALRAYADLRSRRTGAIVKRSWALGRVARWRHPAAVALRERAMALVLRTVGWRGHLAA